MRKYLIVVFVVFLSILASAHSPNTQNNVTATTSYNLNLRAGPGDSFAVIGTVPFNTTVPVFARSTNTRWILVEYQQRGWLDGSLTHITGNLHALPVSDETINDSIVTARTLYNSRMRGGPGTTYAVVGTVPSKTVLIPTARSADDQWLLIHYKNVSGWIACRILEISGDISGLPISDSTIDSLPNPPTPTSQPVGPVTVHLSNVGPHLQKIYNRGRSLGNYSNRFSKVGDSETYNGYYLVAFDVGDYDLGDYGYLQKMITRYSGSYRRMGYAAMGDFMIEAILNPIWSNSNVCHHNETPLACEYRIHRPSISIIMVRTKLWNANWQTNYLNNLRQIVQYTVDQGIIPVLTTLPGCEGHQVFNQHIWTVGNEFNVPVWDLYATTSTLPNGGLGPDMYHLSIPPGNTIGSIYITDENLQYGVTYRNLQTLEVFYILNKTLR
ncbi:MAG: SH3 domain-containing protein [Anaerolineae bacterium]|nr:SH3 domain-containing protein [Anaerolineae bacterium]